MIAILLVMLLAVAAAGAATVGGCPAFPANNIWNVRVDRMPVHPNSADYIQANNPAAFLHADFAAGLSHGAPIGIPFVVVPGTQPRSQVSFQYADESDQVGYPIPPDPPIEGGPNSRGDRHILMVDSGECRLYELFAAYFNPDGGWRAGSGAMFDLKSNAMRADGWTSADAAGLPILVGLVRYDEVLAGEINHAIRITVPNSQNAHLWPARHDAGKSNPNYPPMGLRLRLKMETDISGFSPDTQVILRALQRYGAILADNGSAWFISGVPDDRWNNDHLRELHRLSGADLEAVDESMLMVDKDTAEARVERTPPPRRKR